MKNRQDFVCNCRMSTYWLLFVKVAKSDGFVAHNVRVSFRLDRARSKWTTKSEAIVEVAVTGTSGYETMLSSSFLFLQDDE